jgi:RNA polymerase sigma-32 factor
MPLRSRRSPSARRSAHTPLSFRARPLLEPAEEARLARLYVETRDPKIGDLLVESNLRLVVKIAGEYATPARSELADLVQEGSLGLVEAVRRFDPTRGTRLTTYAGFWIRAFILRHILDTTRLVRLGRGRADRKAFFRGELPPAELSLHAPRSVAPDSGTLLDALPDNDALPADTALARRQIETIVATEAEAFERSLEGRSKAVFNERLRALQPKPLRRLAERFTVSGERLRQIEGEVADRFRTRLAPLLDESAA